MPTAAPINAAASNHHTHGGVPASSVVALSVGCADGEAVAVGSAEPVGVELALGCALPAPSPVRDGDGRSERSGERVTLGGAELATAELAGADVAAADVAGADVAAAEVAGADVAGADVAAADVAGAELVAPTL